MHKVLALVGIFALMTGLMAVAPHSSAAATKGNPLVMPVTAPGGAFNGTFTLTSFALQNGALVANGIISGTDANGVSHFGTVTVPVSTGASTAAAAAPCPILHLVLGPINLNILGLQVTTNRKSTRLNSSHIPLSR